MSTPIARITSDKKLKLKGTLHQTWSSYDGEANIDGDSNLDGEYQFDTETTTIEDFFDYLFTITSTQTAPDAMRFDDRGNLVCPEVYTQEPGLDDTEEIDDTYQLDDTHNFDDTLGIENFITYLFDITTTDVDINYFSIDDKKLLINEVLENQTL